ncbi:caspase family protein [Actinoallomurus spadix]|nr:caspase family protein [Actinoallomurus spadix]
MGVSEYSILGSLPSTSNNIDSLQRVFCSQGIWGLPPQNCKLVRDPLTNPEMLDPLREAAHEATDTLIFYFAGHGFIDQKGQLHLALCDSDSQRPYTAVSYDHVRDLLLEGRAKRTIVILDCCYSGRAIGAMSDSVGAVVDLADIDGAYILAATSADKQAIAPLDGDLTAFTGELIKLIDAGVPNGPEEITLDDIYSHLRDSMRSKGLPLPRKRSYNQIGQLPLVKNQGIKKNSRVSIAAFGHQYRGIEVGAVFPDRRSLYDAHIHRQLRAGICGSAARGGAESIVVSGGYKDDQDFGSVIIYTGHGGRDQDTKQQVKDQDPTDPGNAALLRNIVTGLPVRVIRGAGGDPNHSPPVGFRYDGLFSVGEYWTTKGLDGFRVLQFRLEQLQSDGGIGRSRNVAPNQWELVSNDVYQDRRIAESVMRVHDYECQVCGIFLEIPGGMRFAQTLHLRGLSAPHHGPDIAENILCLCPNHRMLISLGSFVINDNYAVIDEDGEVVGDLRVKRNHRVGLEYIRYHRALHRP